MWCKLEWKDTAMEVELNQKCSKPMQEQTCQVECWHNKADTHIGVRVGVDRAEEGCHHGTAKKRAADVDGEAASVINFCAFLIRLILFKFDV